jgi:hypothetical protein
MATADHFELWQLDQCGFIVNLPPPGALDDKFIRAGQLRVIVNLVVV